MSHHACSRHTARSLQLSILCLLPPGHVLQKQRHVKQLLDEAKYIVRDNPCYNVSGISGAQDCTLKLASHQIRIHNAHDCRVHLRARSNPIIEHSDTLQFASYAPEYPGCDEQLVAAGLNKDNGLWEAVQDFGWLKQSQSPNWYAPTRCNVLYIWLVLKCLSCALSEST